jgi:hypothetical protein
MIPFSIVANEGTEMAITARIQVMPGGIIIGHIVPKCFSANGVQELQENHVYELRVDRTFGTTTYVDLGEADFKVSEIDPRGCGVDRFIATSGGKHLTVDGGH